MAALSFDATQVAPEQGQIIVPAGKYTAEVVYSDVVQTKNGQGHRLKLGFKILDGQYAGNTIFDGLTVAHSNPKAEEIGQRQLSSLSHAVGVPVFNDTEQLHHKPLMIQVAISVDKTGQYPDRNEVKRFYALQGPAPQAPAPRQQQAPQTPAGGFNPGAQPPWNQTRAA